MFNIRRFLAALLVALFVLPAAVQAQGVIYDPVGVFLDGDGVLHTKEVDDSGRLDGMRNAAKGKLGEGNYVYISLPRLFEEARKLTEAGEALPDRIAHLGGMVKVQYIFVYPDTGDLVIAGPAEEIVKTNPLRPVGKESGRPVLHLDDLVVALRIAADGSTPDRIGCDIEMKRDAVELTHKKINEMAKKVAADKATTQEACSEIAKAGGNQPVSWFGPVENTRFGFVCVEADYLLKHLGIGTFKSPVKAVKSYHDRCVKPERNHRFSLESNYDAIMVSPDGDAYEFKGASIMVNTGLLQRLGPQTGEPSIAAKRFMNSANKNIDKLIHEIQSWADLANLGDLSVLAALVGKDKLAEKVNWDLSWILNPEGYAVARVDTPTTAYTLANYKYSENMLFFTSGGTWINPMKWSQNVTISEPGAIHKPKAPEGVVVTEAAPAATPEVDEDTEWIRSRINLAENFLNNDKKDKAIEILREVIEKYPESPETEGARKLLGAAE